VITVSKPAAVTWPTSAAETIAHRAALLTQYQDQTYAERYRNFVERVRRSEQRTVPGSSLLTETVARYYYKLLAYKDEYEVARLFTDERFQDALNRHFEGDYTLKFHLAPPLLARIDKSTGRPIKREYGQWMLQIFKLLARFRRLRGTRWDVFGYTEERQREREIIIDYENAVTTLLHRLKPYNHQFACEIAALPEQVRGYGPVKREAMDNLAAQLKHKLDTYRELSESSAAA
jgi:indolepyruvate ferredoxin oxidoreductase